MNYYNENDPKAAAWLRELIRAGLIPLGDVDERSIVEVKPHELTGYRQQHFFAGIGGWPYALHLARWPEDKPVWTGSCPCQPLSCAGKQKGHADERHLWPAFYRLIAECRPPTIFGEQVASAAGREWLAGVRADMEGVGYACGAADLCAAGVSAPHVRQRLYWVADAESGRLRIDGRSPREPGHAYERVEAERLAFTQGDKRNRCQRDGDTGGRSGSANDSAVIGVGDAPSFRRERLPEIGGSEGEGSRGPRSGRQERRAVLQSSRTSAWSNFEIVHCSDGKARRFEPGSFPMADGIPGRVVKLRGLGNAIVPQVAAEFIRAFEESIAENSD